MNVAEFLREAVGYGSRVSPRAGFRRLVEVLGNRLRVDPQVPMRAPIKLVDFVDRHLDEFVQDQVWQEETIHDPIGALGEEVGFLPRQIRPEDLEVYISHLELPKRQQGYLPPLVMNRTCGTGRKLIAAHRRFGSQAVYAGTESHSGAYRVATINMVLYRVPARILLTKHDYIDPDRYPHDWGWAGQWILPQVAVMQQRYTKKE